MAIIITITVLRMILHPSCTIIITIVTVCLLSTLADIVIITSARLLQESTSPRASRLRINRPFKLHNKFMIEIKQFQSLFAPQLRHLQPPYGDLLSRAERRSWVNEDGMIAKFSASKMYWSNPQKLLPRARLHVIFNRCWVIVEKKTKQVHLPTINLLWFSKMFETRAIWWSEYGTQIKLLSQKLDHKCQRVL